MIRVSTARLIAGQLWVNIHARLSHPVAERPGVHQSGPRRTPGPPFVRVPGVPDPGRAHSLGG